MKRLLHYWTVGLMHAQAFKGKGDVKFDVGQLSKGGSGIRVSADLDLRKHVIWVCYLLFVIGF
jgi:hypothetical protein